MSNLRKDKFMGTLAFAVSGLVAYEVFAVCPTDDLNRQITGAAVTFITMFATLYPALAFVVDSYKISMNLRVSCVAFFLIFLILDFCFVRFNIPIPHFVFTSGIMACLHAGIAYKLLNVKDFDR